MISSEGNVPRVRPGLLVPQQMMGVVCALIAAAALLAGCVVEQVSVQPEGKLDVLESFGGFSSGILPADWAIEGSGKVAENYLSVVEKDGVTSLKVSNGPDSFVIARRTRAKLLATPFLNWGWNMAPHGSGVHPVRLVIGFHGGNPESGSWGSKPFAWLGSALPPHDRAMAIIWGDSALRRGSQSKTDGNSNVAPHYTARGGRENDNTWWLETVDVSRLYAEAWPNDDQSRVQVVYIGVAAAGGRAPSAAYFSEIVLSR